MLKTLIVLPDGTELFSGVRTENAIQSVTITECVNGAQELTLGSCCANMVEVKILTPNGALSVAAGDELAVYRVAEDGTRYKVGLFTTEKPARPTSNSMSITAYDRITWLDRDLTQWLANLEAWPYSLYDLAKMVCEECGLTLLNEEIPNGGHLVQKFSGDGITGRQLMQWIGQIAGRFCRANADGEIEFAWYTPVAIALGAVQDRVVDVSFDDGDLSVHEESANVTEGAESVDIESSYLQIADDGNGNVVLILSDALLQQYYFQNGLSFEDYTVAAVEKVQLRQNEEDIGTVYPDGIDGAVNTYIITGNPLLTASSGDALLPIAQNLYEHLKSVVYTPCKVSVPAGMTIRAGHILQIADRNGKTISAYVMTKTQKGQSDTIECTGSPSRDSTTAVNNQSLKALNGKVLNLRMNVDGMKVENSNNAGKLSSLSLDVEGIRGQVSAQSAETGNIREQLTTVEQTAGALKLSVEQIIWRASSE